MMNFKEFTDEIIRELEERLDNISVEAYVADKNNGVKWCGLIFKGIHNCSPTIYIDDYFREYKEGRLIKHIAEEIKARYLANVPDCNIDVSFFMDFEKVKPKIFFNLINFEKNKELLKKIPYVKYNDLAVVFKYLYSDFGMADVLIRNEHLDIWGIKTDTLYETAMQNTPDLFEHQFYGIAEIINRVMENNGISAENDEMPMYVLSNCRHLYGAGCILYKGLLSEIAERLKSSFYILPSSIHEVLIFPSETSNEKKELSEMVKMVNERELKEEEILSDHVYYFSKDEKRIIM